MRRMKCWLPIAAAGMAFAATASDAKTITMIASVATTKQVSFDVILPLRDEAGLEALLKLQHDASSAQYHHWITPQEFAARFGPTPATMQAVAASFAGRGVKVEPHSRSLHLTASAATINRLLGTTLMMANVGGHSQMLAARTPSMPDAARQAGAVLVDFAATPNAAHVFSQRVPGVAIPVGTPGNRYSTTGGYWYDDLKQAYGYPSYQTMVTVKGKSQRLDGTGTTIGILMSSDIFDSDIKSVFDHEKFSKVTGKPDPKLYARVYVNGGTGTGGGALDEASLDTQQSLGGAPGAHVILYDIPDLSDANIISGYLAIDEDNVADVVSSSFGECELYYLASYNEGEDFSYLLKLEHELYEQGNSQGISFLASSGDEAGLECTTTSYAVLGKAGKFIAGVSTPAADTNVTAVGGTNLVTSYIKGSLSSSYAGENAWSDPEVPYDEFGIGANVTGGYWGAGGGLSTIFSKPSYQALSKTGSNSQRALPDIGMQVGGCPAGISKLPCNGGDQAINGRGNSQRSYVITAIDGTFYGLIGTSVSSPELAGATALLIEQYGRMGNLNQYIYEASAIQSLTSGSTSLPTTVFHRPIPGYNGLVSNASFSPDFNYTVGVGTPIVSKYVGAAHAALAGLPGSASNP